MAIIINSNFHLGAPLVLDDRSYLTKAQMLAIDENIYPDYFLAICSEDGFLYMFDKSISDADKSAETGKFKLFAGDVEEAIKILNSDVKTEGSVLYKIFNEAKYAEYITETKVGATVNLDPLVATTTVNISKAALDECKAGKAIKIYNDKYILTYDDTASEFTVTDATDSSKTISPATVTEGSVTVTSTIKEAIPVTIAEYTEAKDKTKITEGYLKTYELFQNGASIGKIDIPKDLVVTSGTTIEIEKIVDETTGDVSFKIKGTTDTYTEADTKDKESKFYGFPTTASVYIELTIANQTFPIFIDAHDLVDTGSLGKITEDITANVEVGGVAVGDIVKKDTEITDLVKQLLIKYFPPTIKLTGSVTNTVQRIGATLSGLVLTATVGKKSEAIASVVIDGDAVTEEVKDGGVFNKTLTSDITTTTTFIAKASDGKKESTAELTYTFVLPYKHGVSATKTVDDTLVKALTEEVAIEGVQSFSYSPANEYCVFAMPASYGTLTSILDNSSFENLPSWTMTNITVDGEEYNVYVTNTPVSNAMTYKFI